MAEMSAFADPHIGAGAAASNLPEVPIPAPGSGDEMDENERMIAQMLQEEANALAA